MDADRSPKVAGAILTVVAAVDMGDGSNPPLVQKAFKKAQELVESNSGGSLHAFEIGLLCGQACANMRTTKGPKAFVQAAIDLLETTLLGAAPAPAAPAPAAPAPAAEALPSTDTLQRESRATQKAKDLAAAIAAAQ